MFDTGRGATATRVGTCVFLVVVGALFLAAGTVGAFPVLMVAFGLVGLVANLLLHKRDRPGR